MDGTDGHCTNLTFFLVSKVVLGLLFVVFLGALAYENTRGVYVKAARTSFALPIV